MAKIALRAYNREVEKVIEHGQIEEAIAHCKYILRFFPKHIETYRLLGKAYIESQRYSEAADILQRILSVLPDDFVAQIGMSIIREDEGNLDAAIFHMEHAHEIQPANSAVQDELRRLYGRRDGVEPPRLRLTRGALVRLYAKGDLYRQAIAEIRAALAEDPNRFDLEVILARMYFMLGQKVEATDIASRLVAKLPFCMEANKILAEVLPLTSRAEDAKIYQQRVYALDPYLAYISTSAPTSALVPDNAVTLDRLDWQPITPGEEQPAWAQNAGVALSVPGESETIPDWLSTPASIAPEIPAMNSLPSTTQDAVENEQVVSSEIPDWMREAGWGSSTTGIAEQPANEEELVAPAELPDWLKEMAPDEQAPAQSQEDQAKLEWLNQILTPQPVDPTLLSDLNAVDTEGYPVSPAQALPEEPLIPSSVMPTTGEGNLPDWLTITAPEFGGGVPAAETDQLVEDSVQQPTETEAPEAQIEAVIPEMPAEFARAETVVEPAPPEESGAVHDATLLNEASIIPVILEEGAALSTPAEAVIPETPGAVEPTELQAVAAEVPLTVEPLPEAAAAELPEVVPPESLNEAVPVVEQAAGPEVTKQSEFPPLGDEAEPAAAVTERTDEMPAAAPVETAPAVEPPALEPTQPVPAAAPVVPVDAQPDWSDMDAAMAWLEGLAAKQGADQATLSTQAEERSETPPDWVWKEEEQSHPEIQSAALQADETAAPVDQFAAEGVLKPAEAESYPGPAAEIPEIETFPTVPDLEPIQVEPGAEIEPPTASTPAMEPQAAEMMAEPLPPAAIEPAAETVEVSQPTITSAPVSEEIKAAQPQVEQTVSAEAAVALAPGQVDAVEELPLAPSSAVEDSEEPANPRLASSKIKTAPLKKPPEPPAPTEPAEMDADAGFAWLESLAAQQGAAEGTLSTPMEDRPAAAPTWVIDENGTIDKVANIEAESIAEDSTPVEPNLRPVESSDWTQEPETQQPSEVVSAVKPVEPELKPEEEPLPAWMQDFNLPPATTNTLVQPAEMDDLPDWLKGFETPAETPLTQASDESISVSSWLKEQDVLSQEDTSPMPAAVIPTPAPPEPAASVFNPVEIPAPPPVEPAGENTLLGQGRTELSQANIDAAMSIYSQMIDQGQNLGQVIDDLQNASTQHPHELAVWQTLGDAYMRNSQVQEALDAYTKAEELLK